MKLRLQVGDRVAHMTEEWEGIVTDIVAANGMMGLPKAKVVKDTGGTWEGPLGYLEKRPFPQRAA